MRSRSRFAFCRAGRFASLLVSAVLAASPAISRQATPNYSTRKKDAYELLRQSKLAEAEKAFEDLSVAPEAQSDVDVLSEFGFLLYCKMATTTDEQERKGFADRSRGALTKAKDLGDKNSVSVALLNALKNGTPMPSHFSDVPDADAAMQQAELLYLNGSLEAAVAFYQKALAADPTLYEAALDIGDSDYKIPGKMDEAPQWYAKAIAINPTRETAYRYWADALVKQNKPLEARDKYVDAYISEPGNGLPAGALMGWAQGQHLVPAHPKVTIPVKVESVGDKNNITMDVGVGAVNGPSLAAWMIYGGERVSWTKKFPQEYPNETKYRHSLKEEAAALRAAIEGVVPKAKDLDPSLATLIKLEKDGVLESYILLARADTGIAQDYPPYLKEHREILHKYVVNWVLSNGGTQKAASVAAREN